ncbi:MAG: hypothetical protein RIS43_306, partial [Actinomycetota bacterium]
VNSSQYFVLVTTRSMMLSQLFFTIGGGLYVSLGVGDALFEDEVVGVAESDGFALVLPHAARLNTVKSAVARRNFTVELPK